MQVFKFLSVVALFSAGAPLLAQGNAAVKAQLPEKPPFAQDVVPDANKNANASQSGNGKGDDYNFRISGQIVAARKSELSFKVTGYIKTVVKKPGDLVKTGEVLAELDNTDFQLALKMAEAKKHQTEIQARTAKNEFDREQQLKSQNASTGTVFDRVEAGFQEAKLGVLQGELNLQTARRNLANTKLVAPYDCVVAEQVKDDGEYVSPGNKVFMIYENNATEVDLNVPERLVGKLSVGSPLAIVVPSVQFRGQAEVTRVVPIVSDRTRTFRVTARLLDKDKRVVPGLFAEALLN